MPGAGGVTTRLNEIIADAQGAIEELRELGHGIYPMELRERGLGDVVRSLAETAPIRVRVTADGVGRHRRRSRKRSSSAPARQPNTPARAHLTLSLACRDDGLEFEVAVDGPGFYPDEQSGGSGSRACVTASPP